MMKTYYGAEDVTREEAKKLLSAVFNDTLVELWDERVEVRFPLSSIDIIYSAFDWVEDYWIKINEYYIAAIKKGIAIDVDVDEATDITLFLKDEEQVDVDWTTHVEPPVKAKKSKKKDAIVKENYEERLARKTKEDEAKRDKEQEDKAIRIAKKAQELIDNAMKILSEVE